jgi:hypothetical protein
MPPLILTTTLNYRAVSGSDWILPLILTEGIARGNFAQKVVPGEIESSLRSSR